MRVRVPHSALRGGLLWCFIAGAGWLAAATAAAQSERESVAPRLDLFAGGHYAFGLGDVCQRDADVEGCSGGEGFVGAHTLVLLRPFDRFAFGPSLTYGVTPSVASTSAGSANSELTLWRLSAEARYWSSARSRLELYLAAEVGVAFMNEQLDGLEGSIMPRTSSLTVSAPLLGAGIGYGFALPFGLGIVPSLRAFATFFPGEAESFSADIEAHSFGTLYWIAVCLDASFGGAL